MWEIAGDVDEFYWSEEKETKLKSVKIHWMKSFLRVNEKWANAGIVYVENLKISHELKQKSEWVDKVKYRV